MEVKEESKETAYCRVCHGESEPGNELFFPCKCDGSIKYVHQECLVQWLKVSNKQQCELCGEQFHFKKVYKSDAPFHISVVDVVLELIPRALGMLRYSLSTAVAIVMWGVFLPVFTNWWFKVCWCCVANVGEDCMSRVPAFITERSVDGFLSYWYFGLVDVCVIVAASVVSFEVGHTLYREYQIANNNYKIRQLERRLAQNRAALRALEESSLQQERGMFAVADYESMKHEWDLSKRKYEGVIAKAKRGMEAVAEATKDIGHSDNIAEGASRWPLNGQDVDGRDGPAVGTNTPSLPSIEERFLMVQSLANDQVYCTKVVERLNTVCSVVRAPAYTSLRDSYVHLEAELVKTNAECAALIELLPSNLVPMKGDIGRKHTYPPEFMHGLEKVGSQAGAEELREEAAQEVPWYEQPTGISLSDIEPTVDNLELRANLLLRQKMREAAERRQQQRAQHRKVETEENYFEVCEHMSMLEPGSHSTGMKEGGMAPDMWIGEPPIGTRNDTTQDVVPELGAWESQQLWEELAGVQCDGTYYEDCVHQSSSQHQHSDYLDCDAAGDQQTAHQEGPPKTAGADGAPEESEAYAFGFGEYFNTEISMDNLEVALVLDEAIATVEIRVGTEKSSGQTETGDYEGYEPIDMFQESNIQNDEEATADSARTGGPVQAPDSGADGIDQENNAAPAPAADPAAVPAPLEGGEAVPPPPAPAAPPAPPAPPAIVMPPLVGPGHGPGNAQFASLRNILVGYVYMMTFVAVSVLVPALCGELLLTHTQLGAQLVERIESTAHEAVQAEDTYSNLIKLLHYLEFSAEALEQDPHRAYAARVVSANMRGLLTVLFGYGMFASLAVSLLFTSYLQFLGGLEHVGDGAMDVVGAVQRNVQAAGNMVHSLVKLAIMVLCLGIVTPAVLTVLTAKVVNKSLPPYLRFDSAEGLAVLLVIGLFVFSYLITVHIWCITVELRRNINRRYLVGILPEGDEQDAAVNAQGNNSLFSLLEKLKDLSYSHILKRILIRSSIVLPAFVVCVVVPIRWGHLLCPLEGPLKFRLKQTSGDVQIPVEMMLSHIFLPLIIEKLRYKAVVKAVVSAYLRWMAPLLGLEWMLADPAERPVEPAPPAAVLAMPAVEVEVAGDPAAEPANALNEQGAAPAAIDTTAQGRRPAGAGRAGLPSWLASIVLIMCGLACLAVISSWVLHAPLAAGRLAMVLTRLPTHNDLFNYPVGLLLCWGLGFVVHYIGQDVARNADVQHALTAVAKWVLHAVKVVGVGVLWLGLPPMILGVLLEAMIVMPLRVTHEETPNFPFLQNWALGLVLLKAFSKCVLNGMFGELDLRNQMEMVLIRGFAQFDAAVCLRRIVLPVTLFLTDLLFTPYFLARCACMVVPSPVLQNLMVRYCYHAYIAVICVGYGAYQALAALVKLHTEVRDSKYLIGTRLTNRA